MEQKSISDIYWGDLRYMDGEEHERQKSDDTVTGVTLISVASEEGGGLHDVMYRPSPDTCSKVDTLEMRMSVLQDGAVNYSYVTSAEDEESVLSIGCLAGQGDYDVHQNLPLYKKSAACAAPNAVNKDSGRYSLQRTSMCSTSLSQQIGNKSISSTSGSTEFQNSSSLLSLDSMTVPFLFYSTIEWEDTPTAPTKEKYNGNNDVVSCQVSEVSNTFKCSKTSDGGLESKAEPEDNANSVANGNITEESQNNIMTTATNLEEPVSI